MTTHEVRLLGCRPLPLASYLKGLAVLRLVAEQADPEARGCFEDDVFVLRSTLDEEALVGFFLERYRPSPVVSPWNGGSGFYAGGSPKARKTLQRVRDSTADRWSAYRSVIAAGERALSALGYDAKARKNDKDTLISLCRNQLPDQALPWLDAALVLTTDGTKYPPLLGTGGNDGNFDFTNNFMQRLLDVLDPTTDGPAVGSGERLLSSLLREAAPVGVRNAAVGQFLPGDSGGANSSAGYNDDSTVNPWDFVLMIEGALFFATAAVRRLASGARDALAYPFTVRPTAAGYGNAAPAEASRGEIWLPIWERPARVAEVHALFSEGRARVGRRPVRDGVDFARALATLGVDRGISSFQRYGFHVRNGLSYFATPLSRLAVRRREAVLLLDEIDPWLESFRRRGDLPGSVARAVRETERTILAACRVDDTVRMQAVLVALGRLERALGRSLAYSLEKRIPPVPRLSPRWLTRATDGSVELRLAASLASTARYANGRWTDPIRTQVVPAVIGGSGLFWRKDAGREVVPMTGDPVTWLNRILSRRIVDAVRDGLHSWSDRSRFSAELADVADFVEGRTDDARLVDLFRSLLLVDWRRVEREQFPPGGRRSSPRPDSLFSLLALCFAGRRVRDVRIPLVPPVHVRAAAGDGESASAAAARRLRGSGLSPHIGTVYRRGEEVRRAAAALLFPLGNREIRELADSVLPSPTAQPVEMSADDGGEGGR